MEYACLTYDTDIFFCFTGRWYPFASLSPPLRLSDRNDRSQQAICMLEHIQIFPHPLVDRAVSALHRVMRLNDVPRPAALLETSTPPVRAAAAHPAENECTAPLQRP